MSKNALHTEWNGEIIFKKDVPFELTELVWSYGENYDIKRKHAEIQRVKGWLTEFPECQIEGGVNYLFVFYLAAMKHASADEFKFIRAKMYDLTFDALVADEEYLQHVGFGNVIPIEGGIGRFVSRESLKARFCLTDIQLDVKMAYAHKQLGKTAPIKAQERYTLQEFATFRAFSKVLILMRSWYSDIYAKKERMHLRFKDKIVIEQTYKSLTPTRIDTKTLDDLFA